MERFFAQNKSNVVLELFFACFCQSSIVVGVTRSCFPKLSDSTPTSILLYQTLGVDTSIQILELNSSAQILEDYMEFIFGNLCIFSHHGYHSMAFGHSGNASGGEQAL